MGALILGLFLIAASPGLKALENGLACEDAGLLSGGLLEDFCLECLLPVRIATLSSQPEPLPRDLASDAVCSCDGETYGVSIGSWHPVRLIEVVTTPGCSPILGGIQLFQGMQGFRGTTGPGEPVGSGTAFFHVHSFPVPFMALLDPLSETPCRSINDAAPAYFSELDPGWNVPGLSMIDQPEAAFFLNPPGIKACAADAAASASGMPLDELFWCAGSWGTLYPMQGAMRATLGTDPSLTSLAAIRQQARLHRSGMGLKTTGNEALCGGIPSPFMEKSQYRLSRIYPVRERPLNHAVGESTLRWASLPEAPKVQGQATLYLLWRFEECCIPVF